MYLSHIVSTSNNCVTLKAGLGIIQGRSKWHHSIDRTKGLKVVIKNYSPWATRWSYDH